MVLGCLILREVPEVLKSYQNYFRMFKGSLRTFEKGVIPDEAPRVLGSLKN